ncbi:MAG: uncharacterized protein JWP97_5475 [Labilithrix sp.]|nr:uncharacterized protein [Labilithrix sp.]
MAPRPTRLSLLAAGALLACTPQGNGKAKATSPEPASAPAATPQPPNSGPVPLLAWRYEVNASPRGGSLAIEVDLPAGSPTVLGVGEGGEPFVTDVMLLEAGGRRPVPPARDGVWSIPECARGCQLAYTFELRKAGTTVHERSVADARGDVIEAPPSTWLLYPLGAPSGSTYRFHVTPAPGEAFVSGVFPVPDVADTYEGRLARPFDLPYAAFGPLRREIIAGGHVEVARGPGAFRDEAAVAAWLERSAKVVATYYRQAPVPRALVLVRATSGRRVGFGSTMGSSGAAIDIAVGADVTSAALRDDWVLVHEMIHTALPDLDRQHHWLEEGLATYVEPIARARAGLVTPERVFAEWVAGMAKGQPEAGDEGLDRTHTWGRTYWGGALFCLVADVEIRTRTAGKRSLDDALRAIVTEGGSIAVHWPIERLLEVGDRGAGVPVLAETFARMAPRPEKVDLDALWKRLGVVPHGDTVTFDDAAPLAAVRRAMLTP